MAISPTSYTMMFPAGLIPADEEARLQALAPFQRMQALPDVVFDAFVELVALAFHVPVAMLSFVNADAVWMKALYGLSEPRRVPRNQSLCSLTILQEATTVIQNLNETVLPVPVVDLLNKQLKLCFYAGHPLQAQQYRIGVLGIADRTARVFDEAQQQRLRSLAVLAMQMLQLRLVLSHSKENPSSAWVLFHDELTQCLMQLAPGMHSPSAQLQQIDKVVELLQHKLGYLQHMLSQ